MTSNSINADVEVESREGPRTPRDDHLNSSVPDPDVALAGEPEEGLTPSQQIARRIARLRAGLPIEPVSASMDDASGESGTPEAEVKEGMGEKEGASPPSPRSPAGVPPHHATRERKTKKYDLDTRFKTRRSRWLQGVDLLPQPDRDMSAHEVGVSRAVYVSVMHLGWQRLRTMQIESVDWYTAVALTLTQERLRDHLEVCTRCDPTVFAYLLDREPVFPKPAIALGSKSELSSAPPTRSAPDASPSPTSTAKTTTTTTTETQTQTDGPQLDPTSSEKP